MGKLCGILAVTSLVVFGCAHSAVTASDRLDVFHEVLEKLNATGNTLPVSSARQYYDAVFRRISCTVNGTALPNVTTQLDSCRENLCLNITQLLTTVGGNDAIGLSEKEFENASMVTLYILSKGSHPCRSTVGPQGALVDIQQRFQADLQRGNRHLTVDDLDDFLHDNIAKVYSGVEHDHAGTEADAHSRRRRREAENATSTDNVDDHHDDHNDAMSSVVEAKCLAPDAILYYVGTEEEGRVDVNNFGKMTSIIIYLMSEASAIEEKCRLLPKKSDFVKQLISIVMAGNMNLTRAGLEKLMGQLGITPSTAAADTQDAHNHMRKRRSVHDYYVSVSRVKRQTTVADAKCYTPSQLVAVFETGDVITAEKLTQLSPALVLQKAYASCAAVPTHADTHEPTLSEKWGYSFLATFLICMCSLAGATIAPCMNRVAYKVFLALFVGLAVGTLTGDALLHLIPMTMGADLHSEDDGHEPTVEEIIIEKYVWFALITIGGIYLFYLIETGFARWIHKKTGHGHSHSMELAVDAKQPVDLATAVAYREPQKKGNLSLSIMIILGDAIHNFADGLALGAAFSSNVNVGIATAIAVFCHELPHELGDFAVLLQNGMSLKKAMFWNLFSALTAFIGLIVSLLVATDDEVRLWIFAVTAGMFLYIALTDLLPQLTSGGAGANNLVFVMNNVGMMLGIAIMLLIAIFEERIKID